MDLSNRLLAHLNPALLALVATSTTHSPGRHCRPAGVVVIVGSKGQCDVVVEYISALSSSVPLDENKLAGAYRENATIVSLSAVEK